jgi:protoheme IX farnesyltransferase
MMKAVAVEPGIAPVDALTARSAPATAFPIVAEVGAIPARVSPVKSRLADYLELTKPKIAVMALFTVAAGYLLGAASASAVALFHVLLGAGLVAAGGSALNQWLERRIDARMPRTANRPLPAGRLAPAEALTFGLALSVVGLAYLFLRLPYPAGVVAAATLVSYVAIYTPLKTLTVWNTVVGAVPGALPPVIGWAAARGWDSPWGGLSLFLVIFVWQLPHFLAIAWMYRADYAHGGLRMLPGIDPTGGKTAAVMILTCVALVPVGLVPLALGIGGWPTAAGAALCGLLFLRQAVRFARTRTDAQARKVLRASLLYLPAVLGLLLIDGLLAR